MHMANKRVTPRPKRPLYRPTFLRQWRELRGLTLEDVGEAIGLSHAQIGRIERGLQPYNQGLLEALADLYATDVASLIMRNPADPDAPWSIWDNVKKTTPEKRAAIVAVVETMLKTGTDGQ